MNNYIEVYNIMQNVFLDFEQVGDDEMYLFMGGVIINGGFFREKDVMEDDYSQPRLSGQYEVTQISKMDSADKELYNVYIDDGHGTIMCFTDAELSKLITNGSGKRIFDDIQPTIKQE